MLCQTDVGSCTKIPLPMMSAFVIGNVWFIAPAGSLTCAPAKSFAFAKGTSARPPFSSSAATFAMFVDSLVSHRLFLVVLFP